MRLTDSAFGVPAKHARDFHHALVAIEDPRVRSGDAGARAFRDDDVMVRPCGNLWQVGDREHLMVRGNTPHGLTHLEPNAATNSRIDLVEDERWNVVEASENRFQREHHARQLTP